jgi:hypothetical protein
MIDTYKLKAVAPSGEVIFEGYNLDVYPDEDMCKKAEQVIGEIYEGDMTGVFYQLTT